MKPTIRFIHAADLHLDSPYVGMQNLPEPIFKDVKESTLLAYNRLIELAIEEKVDFVLFVGDLFDQQSTSIKSVITLKRGLEKLKEHGIYAYISYGNHDFGIGEKVDLTFPDNTICFSVRRDSNVFHLIRMEKKSRKFTVSAMKNEQSKRR